MMVACLQPESHPLVLDRPNTGFYNPPRPRWRYARGGGAGGYAQLEVTKRRDEILRLLRAHREDLIRLGVKSLALFGSVARDEAGVESDVDLLVVFAAEPGFDGYMAVKFYLGDLLGHRVDLVMDEALKPWARSAVERDAICVA
jgi:predicted nucleotidyltransferase